MMRNVLIITGVLLGLIAQGSLAQEDHAASYEALSAQLNLNEQQQQQVRQLINAYAAKVGVLQEKTKALRAEMQQVQLDRLRKADIKRMSQSAGSVAARHTGAVLQTQLDFYNLLNAGQKQEYLRLRREGRVGDK